MKKIAISIFTFALLATVGCKNEKNDSDSSDNSEDITVQKYVVKPEATSVKWTAYKTTEKKGVGGEFSVLNFDNKSGATPQEALNNLEFSIPISNLITKDESRDAKIKASFFGQMLNTEFIKGTIKVVDNNYLATLTMNGVTKDLPLAVTITDERRVNLKGTMLLKDWDALGALAALNKACFDLHKGPDGVSKTWDNVAIEVNTFLRKK